MALIMNKEGIEKMDMTASSKKELIRSTVFVKPNANYSTSKYCCGIQGARLITMAKDLSISGSSSKSQYKFSMIHTLLENVSNWIF